MRIGWGNRGGWRRDIGLDLCQKNSLHVSQIFVSTGVEVKIGGFQGAARWEKRLWVERRNRGRVLGGLGHGGRRGVGMSLGSKMCFEQNFKKKVIQTVFSIFWASKRCLIKRQSKQAIKFSQTAEWGSGMKPDESVHNLKKKIKKPECQSIECQTDCWQEIISLWLERNREKIE